MIAIAVAIAAAQGASAASPYIWPVAGLYGVDSSACSPETKDPTAAIDPDLCPALSVAMRKDLGAEFAQLMKARFPNVEERFAEHLPSSATPGARLNSTLVASLRVTRAQIWTVQRGAGVDGYLPLTLTLDITNAATGDVLFSRTRTEVGQGSYDAGEVRSQLAGELARQLRRTMTELIDSAAAEWKPSAQTADVIGKAGDYWVLDRGRAEGFRTGDTIGDAELLFSAADYSIAKPILGSLTKGQVLSRTVATPVALLARPSLLSVLLDGPDGQGQYLSQIFDDAVASKTGFAPVPVNPAFARLRTQALGEAQEVAQDSRSLPDYVAALSVVTLKPARFASNIPGVEIARYEAHAFVSLVDSTGRVVFTAEGVGRIEDKIAGGVSFGEQQRQDTVVRNALLDAAGKLAAFKPQPIEVPVGAAGARVLVRDGAGAVPIGAQLTVLRPSGTVKGIKVKVPIAEVTTVEFGDGGLLADNSGMTAVAIRDGDVVALESNGKPLQSRAPVVRCRGGEAIDDRGAVPFPLFATAADNLFAAGFSGPVYLARLPGKLQFVSAAFGDKWKQFQPARSANAQACFTPVLSVSAPGTDRGKIQRSLTIGFTLSRGGQKVGGAGLQASFSPTPPPEGKPQGSSDAMLQQDLATVALPLAAKAGGQLKAN